MVLPDRNNIGMVWDRFPDMINLQKIKRKAARKCFPLRLVHFLLPEMMRRFILTLEILFVSLFLLGGSFPETETARNTSGGFSWKDYRTIAHALGGMDGKDYLNSREGFLFMYEQGVRLFELDLSRTSDGVWNRHPIPFSSPIPPARSCPSIRAKPGSVL